MYILVLPYSVLSFVSQKGMHRMNCALNKFTSDIRTNFKTIEIYEHWNWEQPWQ